MSNVTIKLSKHMEQIAKELDAQIKVIAGERIGWSLVVYTEGRASYISNVDRDVAIPELEALLGHWKSDMPGIKAHEVM